MVSQLDKLLAVADKDAETVKLFCNRLNQFFDSHHKELLIFQSKKYIISEGYLCVNHGWIIGKRILQLNYGEIYETLVKNDPRLLDFLIEFVDFIQRSNKVVVEQMKQYEEVLENV